MLARLPMGNVFSKKLVHMHKNIFSATVNTDNSKLTIMGILTDLGADSSRDTPTCVQLQSDEDKIAYVVETFLKLTKGLQQGHGEYCDKMTERRSKMAECMLEAVRAKTVDPRYESYHKDHQTTKTVHVPK